MLAEILSRLEPVSSQEVSERHFLVCFHIPCPGTEQPCPIPLQCALWATTASFRLLLYFLQEHRTWSPQRTMPRPFFGDWPPGYPQWM
jgi:hypothetical protein